jgi:hypothetical protein
MRCPSPWKRPTVRPRPRRDDERIQKRRRDHAAERGRDRSPAERRLARCPTLISRFTSKPTTRKNTVRGHR